MWLDLAIAISCGGGGVVCGWIMHALGGFGNQTLVRQAAASVNGPESITEPTPERVSEVANRLKAYALNMAADVDAHQTTVQAVNNSLLEGQESSPEVVLTAVGQLIEANEKMQTQLREAQDRIHEQTVQIETAERRAQTDALTRVPNRGAFDQHIASRHKLGPGKAGTLALMDVDHFKKFNDVYGHRAGDEVLRVVANVLHARLQKYGLVARFGGEEFAVILDGYSVEEASQLVEEARRAIGDREIQFENKSLRVTASMGVAELSGQEPVDQWLQRADDALYHSKEAGRDCGHWMKDRKQAVRIELQGPAGKEPKAPEPAEPPAPAPAEPPVAEAVTPEPDPAPVNHTPVPDGLVDSLAEANSADADDDSSTADAKPGAFAYLPDRETLGTEFDEIRGRTQANVALFVMAIRCHSEPDATLMRSLLQIVRATMRAVDRLGCEDESTILICMPSVNASTAMQRGQQICRSASAVALGATADGGRAITVGVAEAIGDEDFSEVVSRSVAAAEQCRQENRDCLCVDAQQAAV